MKLFKKFVCSFLLGMTVLTSVGTTAHAEIHAGPLTFHHYESATVTITSGLQRVYDFNGNVVAQYSPGQSFYYDSVYTSDSLGATFYFASYISYSGVRRFVNTSYIDQRTGQKVYVNGISIQ